MIDINNNLRITKTTKKEEKLKLTNELKLITAPDDVYKLWAEVITAAAFGELVNPDMGRKFNARDGWNPENCMLTREFFKHLGNLSYDELATLARHMLNQTGEKRKQPYPKVTVKSVSLVLDSCYTAGEWSERWKRKHLVKKELHQIDPELGLMNAKNEIIVENWKKFKTERMFSRATMDVLLDRASEVYFGKAKSVSQKNKTCVELSPQAFKFFNMFLKHKNNFKKPSAMGFYRSYNNNSNIFRDWPDCIWQDDIVGRMSLGVLDFRTLSGVENKESSIVDSPYFKEVMLSLQKRKDPALKDVPAWLFICGDEKEQAQVLRFVEKDEVLNTYELDFSIYSAGKVDRLGDIPVANKPPKVLLVFLQRPGNNARVPIQDEFTCPEFNRYVKARAYSEVEYPLNNLELRMEFYIWLVSSFCTPEDYIYSVFAGGKLTCVAMVSNAIADQRGSC